MYQQNSFFTKKQIVRDANKILEEGLNDIMKDVKKQLEEIVEYEKGSEDALTPEDIEKCLKKGLLFKICGSSTAPVTCQADGTALFQRIYTF